MSVTATDLVSEYGAYYLNNPANMERLYAAIRQKRRTTDLAVLKIVKDTIYQASKTSLGNIVQPFQKAFTEKGVLDFDPATINLYKMKVDISMYPDDIEESWIGFLASIEEKERKNWPLIRYAIEKEIVPQIDHDLETKEYFNGVYAAPTPGSAGATGTSMTGLKKIIDDGLTAATIKQVSLTGGITASNALDQVEAFVDNFVDELEGVPMIVAMSPSNRMKYFRDKRNTLGGNTNYGDNRVLTIDGKENCQIVGLPSMAGSDYICATPLQNYFHVRRQNGITTPRVEESKRECFFMTDWYEGLGFGRHDLVYAYAPEDSGSGSAS
ncbi:MAG: hypothetical protein J5I47_01965 [Vicingus serpentipes]|nr:hypothetical protein [Vicingus serpentipes]